MPLGTVPGRTSGDQPCPCWVSSPPHAAAGGGRWQLWDQAQCRCIDLDSYEETFPIPPHPIGLLACRGADAGMFHGTGPGPNPASSQHQSWAWDCRSGMGKASGWVRRGQLSSALLLWESPGCLSGLCCLSPCNTARALNTSVLLSPPRTSPPPSASAVPGLETCCAREQLCLR